MNKESHGRSVAPPPPHIALSRMGKRKIPIEKIQNKQNRMVTFSKRRKDLFKKSQDLTNLSGSSIAILVLSQTGRPYIHGSPSFDSVVGQFLSTTTAGSSTITAGSSTIAAGSSQDALKALLDFDIEACDNVEELMALIRDMEQVRKRVTDRRMAMMDLNEGTPSCCSTLCCKKSKISVPNVVMPSISVAEGEEKDYKIDEEKKQNISASSIPRPHALLSSPEKLP